MAQLTGTGRLGDDLYLLAHHDITGKPLLQPRPVGVGLAGALLAELVVLGNIRIQSAGVVVADAAPPREELAGSVLALIVGEHDRHPVRDWLLFLARTAPEGVAGRLSRAGYLTRTSSRRPWRDGRWVPIDPDCAFAPVARVQSVLGRPGPVTGHGTTLAGLAAACGLGAHLALYLPPGARHRLDQAVTRLHPDLREVIAQTQATVDSAVPAHRV